MKKFIYLFIHFCPIRNSQDLVGSYAKEKKKKNGNHLSCTNAQKTQGANYLLLTIIITTTTKQSLDICH